MKNIVIIVFIVFSTFSAFSQWQTDERFTNNADTSLSTGNSIAVSGRNIHVVWYDKTGNLYFQVWYKGSTNGGQSWSENKLIATTLTNKKPTISASGQVVHIAWESNKDGNYEIYYRRSPDNGISWGAVTRLTNNSALSEYPVLACSGNNVHLVWIDERDMSPQGSVYTKRSTDGGLTWGSDIRLTVLGTDAFVLTASVAVKGDIVHIAFSADIVGFNTEIYYLRSPDNGLSWGSFVRLTNFSGDSYLPVISVADSTIHLAWQDNRTGNSEIYYKRSTNLGLNWAVDTRMTNNTAPSDLPFVISAGNNVHLVWQESKDGNPEIYYLSSANNGNSWFSEVRLTNNSWFSAVPSAAVMDSALFVLWHDNREGNYELYIKKNPTGNPIGIQQISTEVPSGFELSQNYPNPFNPTTYIKISVPESEFVNLSVYDITGREVDVLVNNKLNPGIYNVDFNASHLSSGVYFYRLTSGSFTDVKKMMLVK
ncbi:MAG: T9SS type A sorting domain-containing protein [Ignavibacteria bacterium]|nr:T9SS type A sorting domain-containing protein [Ignavibacteria bacterium]